MLEAYMNAKTPDINGTVDGRIVFGVPGPAGPQGEPGPAGPQGEKGDIGPAGPTGATPNIQIGTVETLAAGSPATASMGGTPENPLLNLGIPQGASGSGGSGISVTGATVGQTVRIAAVDDGGVPTAWEPVDFPSGESIGAGENWELIANGAIDEESTALIITKDNAGESFELKRWFLRMRISPVSENADNSIKHLCTIMFNSTGGTTANTGNNVSADFTKTRYYQCFGEPIPGAGIIFAHSLSNNSYNSGFSVQNHSYYHTKTDSLCFGIKIGYPMEFNKYVFGAGSEYYLYGVRV